MRYPKTIYLTGIVAILFLSSCFKKESEPVKNSLIEIAASKRLWTGVAVSEKGRIFVNYPRWTPVDSFAVAEIMENESKTPYPNLEWNSWNSSKTATDHFICVQSVYMDQWDNLWILDSGLDIQQGILPGGAKLIKIDLKTNIVLQKIYFDETVAKPGCYLNDVRIDINHNYAYITDSGLGAIIVADLLSGKSGRLLVRHESTKSQNISLTIEEKEWRYPDGSIPQIHADGIALNSKSEYLYYQALTSHTLYRIKTNHLRNLSLPDSMIGKKVEMVGHTGAADGIAFDSDGNLYISAIEMNTIKRLTPDWKVETVIKHVNLKWPDSFSITKDGSIYVTTSQIHLGEGITEPFRIYKISP